MSDVLLADARAYALELGTPVPGRNALKARFHIGSGRADKLRELLSLSEPKQVPAPVPEPERAPEETEPPSRRTAVWPLALIALPAFVAVWSGWVGLGQMTGFGVVTPLPGIMDSFSINSAITLPVGVEVYAAYALYVWLGRRGPRHAQVFARASALAALGLGAAGQVAYHLLEAAGRATAPWPVTLLVACLPVLVLGAGAALAHMVHSEE